MRLCYPSEDGFIHDHAARPSVFEAIALHDFIAEPVLMGDTLSALKAHMERFARPGPSEHPIADLGSAYFAIGVHDIAVIPLECGRTDCDDQHTLALRDIFCLLPVGIFQ